MVTDVELELSSRRLGTLPQTEETIFQTFDAKVQLGRLHSAVRHLTNRETGGVLHPLDQDASKDQTVLDTLKSKHPAQRDPPIHPNSDERDCFKEYCNLPESIPLDITANTIENVAPHLSGAAGPSGIDAIDLRNWLLRFGRESQLLRETLAKLGRWLANDDPPWAAYRALMACRLIALDKRPGVCPIGIGETI